MYGFRSSVLKYILSRPTNLTLKDNKRYICLYVELGWYRGLNLFVLRLVFSLRIFLRKGIR